MESNLDNQIIYQNFFECIVQISQINILQKGEVHVNISHGGTEFFLTIRFSRTIIGDLLVQNMKMMKCNEQDDDLKSKIMIMMIMRMYRMNFRCWLRR